MAISPHGIFRTRSLAHLPAAAAAEHRERAAYRQRLGEPGRGGRGTGNARRRALAVLPIAAAAAAAASRAAEAALLCEGACHELVGQGAHGGYLPSVAGASSVPLAL